MPVPRLSDGSPDKRTQELETVETNQIDVWIQARLKDGDMEHLETSNGMTRYRMLKEWWRSDD